MRAARVQTAGACGENLVVGGGGWVGGGGTHSELTQAGLGSSPHAASDLLER